MRIFWSDMYTTDITETISDIANMRDETAILRLILPSPMPKWYWY